MVRSLRKRWHGSRRRDDRPVQTKDRRNRLWNHLRKRWAGARRGTCRSRSKNRANRRRVTNETRCLQGDKNRHGGTWGIKMKDHSTSRLASRVKDTLRLCREFVSRSTGFHASNGRRAVPVCRHARFIRLVDPTTPLLRSASLIPVCTDRGVHPRSRS